MFKIIAIIKYLTPCVILEANCELNLNSGRGALYKLVMGGQNSYLENAEMVYSDKSALLYKIPQIKLDIM